jgi:hypothetical protein
MTTGFTARLLALAYALAETEGEQRDGIIREFSNSVLGVIQDGGSDWVTRREVIRPAIKVMDGRISRSEAQEISSAVGNRLFLLRALGEEEKLIDETPIVLTVQHQLNAINKVAL